MFEWPFWDTVNSVFLYLLVLAVITVVMAAVVFIGSFDDHRPGVKQRKLKIGGVVVVAIWLVFIAGLNWLHLRSSERPGSHDTYQTARTAAQYFGLRADTDYPLATGDQPVDTSFSIVNGLAQSKSNAMLLVSFTGKQQSYLLQLPLSRITFVQSTQATPSIRLHLRGYIYGVIRKRVFTQGCTFHVRALQTECKPTYLGHRTTYNPVFRRLGLSSLVAKHLSSARITLTPVMYQQIVSGGSLPTTPAV